MIDALRDDRAFIVKSKRAEFVLRKRQKPLAVPPPFRIVPALGRRPPPQVAPAFFFLRNKLVYPAKTIWVIRQIRTPIRPAEPFQSLGHRIALPNPKSRRGRGRKPPAHTNWTGARLSTLLAYHGTTMIFYTFPSRSCFRMKKNRRRIA